MLTNDAKSVPETAKQVQKSNVNASSYKHLNLICEVNKLLPNKKTTSLNMIRRSCSELGYIMYKENRIFIWQEKFWSFVLLKEERGESYEFTINSSVNTIFVSFIEIIHTYFWFNSTSDVLRWYKNREIKY